MFCGNLFIPVFFHYVLILPNAIHASPEQYMHTLLREHNIEQTRLEKKKGMNTFYSSDRLISANISDPHEYNYFSIDNRSDGLAENLSLTQFLVSKSFIERHSRTLGSFREMRSDLDSGRPSMPPLKAGKLELEFLIGGASGVVGSLILGFLGGAITNRNDDPWSELNGFAVGMVLGTIIGSSIGVEIVGSYGDETGTYWATLLGSTGGMAASLIYIALRVREDSAEWFDWAMIYALPAAGAVLGFNLTRRYDTPPASGSALLNFEDGQIIFTVPDFCLHPNPFIPGDYLQTVQLLNVRF